MKDIQYKVKINPWKKAYYKLFSYPIFSKIEGKTRVIIPVTIVPIQRQIFMQLEDDIINK